MIPREPVTFTAAAAVLAAQPFTRHVGARLTEFGGGAATLELEVGEHHRQQFGLVHGGVWAYLADNAITFAAGSALGASVLTAGFSIEYVRPARGGVLRARARVEDADGRQAVCVALLGTADSGASSLCGIAHGRVIVSSREDP